MTEKNKNIKLDPIDQENWDEGAKEFSGDFDELVKKSQEQKGSKEKVGKHNSKGIPTIDYGELEKEWKNEEKKRDKKRLPNKDKDKDKDKKYRDEYYDKMIKYSKEKKEKLEKEEQLKDIKENEKELLESLGKEMKEKRSLYLQKNYEMNKVSKKISGFFKKNFKFGSAESDLNIYKEEYEVATQKYVDTIVEIEGINDKEEQEIMLRYLKVSETLNLEEGKLATRFKNNHELEWTKQFIGSGVKRYLEGYKKTATFLSRKASKIISQKIDSKVLQMGGGLGGGMAFAVGLSHIFKTAGAPYWAIRSIMLANSTASMSLENKKKLDEDFEKNKKEEIEKNIQEKLKELVEKSDKGLIESMRSIFGEEAKQSLNKVENKESEIANKKRWLNAFKKAIGRNTFFYVAGFGVAEITTEGFSKVLSKFSSNLSDSVNQEIIDSKTKIEPTIRLYDSSDVNDIEASEISDDKIDGREGQPDSMGSKEIGETMGVSKSFVEARTEFEKNGLIDADAYKEFDSLYGEDAYNEYIKAHSGEIDVEKNWEESVKNGKEQFMGKALNEKVGGMTIKSEVDIEEEVEKNVDSVVQQSFSGIELDEDGMGSLTIKKGSSIKDTLKNFFMEKENKGMLTAGGMGWDAESGKFASVEDWAEKRAIGIAGEFAEKMGDYNINKVSAGSNIVINLSDTADIRIEQLNDPLELGEMSAKTNIKVEESSSPFPFNETPVEEVSVEDTSNKDILNDQKSPQITVENVENLQPVDGVSAEESTGNKTEIVSNGMTEEQYVENLAKIINSEAGELKKILFDGNINLWNEIKNHFAIGGQNENFAKFYRSVSNQLELYARPDETVDSWIIRMTELAYKKGMLLQIKNQIPEIIK